MDINQVYMFLQRENVELAQTMSIMQLLPQDMDIKMELHSGTSRIHGVLLGEVVDTSRSSEERMPVPFLSATLIL